MCRLSALFQKKGSNNGPESQSLDAAGGRGEADGHLDWKSKRQNNRRALRFKAHGTETDWLADGRQQK